MKLATTIVFLRIFLALGISHCADLDEQEFPRVVTPLGEVEGYYKNSSDGLLYEAYEGIRYAEAPWGESRFTVAKSVSPWTETLLAKDFGPICMQFDQSATNLVSGSEDCLYLNIYTAKNRDSQNLLPVIFFIHGGAWRMGSGADYGPTYLLNHNVVYVNFNYRLGPLGFLSTEDDVVPGNMGLKDQVIALQWVNDNIESFGGDPSRIIIFGSSAGGASVQFHYLSDLSRGLFQGGMSMSGTVLSSWAQAEASLEKAKKVAKLVGCSTDEVTSMIDCLRDSPAEDIVRTIREFWVWLEFPVAPFGPVIEKEGGEFTFLDRSPVDIITCGDAQDLPWITGSVSEEALGLAANIIVNETLLAELNSNWTALAPYVFDYYYTIPKSEHSEVASLIRQHYLGDLPIDQSTINQTIKMISDRVFNFDNAKAAKLQARFIQSPVRYYYFSYRGAHSYSEVLSGSSENYGVSHFDDVAYALKMDITDTSTTPKDIAMQKTMTNLWASFATDLVPDEGVEWSPLQQVADEDATENNLNYLHIAGPSDLYMESVENFGDESFWDSIDFDENRETRRAATRQVRRRGHSSDGNVDTERYFETRGHKSRGPRMG